MANNNDQNLARFYQRSLRLPYAQRDEFLRALLRNLAQKFDAMEWEGFLMIAFEIVVERHSDERANHA